MARGWSDEGGRRDEGMRGVRFSIISGRIRAQDGVCVTWWVESAHEIRARPSDTEGRRESEDAKRFALVRN